MIISFDTGMPVVQETRLFNDYLAFHPLSLQNLIIKNKIITGIYVTILTLVWLAWFLVGNMIITKYQQYNIFHLLIFLLLLLLIEIRNMRSKIWGYLSWTTIMQHSKTMSFNKSKCFNRNPTFKWIEWEVNQRIIVNILDLILCLTWKSKPLRWY